LRDAPRLLEQGRRAHPGPGGPLSAAVAGAYHLLHGDGDVDTAHRLLTTAIDELGDPRDAHNKVLIEALYTLLMICFFGGRADLWPPLQRAIQHGRGGGAVTSAIEALFLLAQDAFHTGRWDEARQLTGEGLRPCGAHGYHLLPWPGRLTAALLSAARGDSQAGGR
jgi:hypothetical protein